MEPALGIFGIAGLMGAFALLVRRARKRAAKPIEAVVAAAAYEAVLREDELITVERVTVERMVQT